jgi:subtilisin family serine protease
MACIFSNYGQVHVDLFAPGENIVALDTNNTFEMHSGTSQATPVVTGVAATILSYYPDLKPQDLISILLESSFDVKKQKVEIPDLINDKRKIVKFKTLSKSGGIVNLYNAIKKAEKYKL